MTDTTAPADETLIFSHFGTFHLTAIPDATKARSNESSPFFMWTIWVFWDVVLLLFFPEERLP